MEELDGGRIGVNVRELADPPEKFGDPTDAFDDTFPTPLGLLQTLE